ncbi:GIY-YIG nuclease family protein [Galbibacter sp. EGI 63066]|uniref:GIY-YIG nuclease family protein n=1 Tax=Galbibacter sp. EGI 63066 TaxID=2993559 RepID=UPI0022490A96|nr:GIY-YIG nuclease family protein [Galbibacter sp. EGI 63066]MCX2680689.1 GIY-YIG nuclease family protein [Galbibacter sp. EGI 63066]
MKLYYVYILECSDKSFYIGITSDVEKRVYQHNVGMDRSSYTYDKRPVKLKWVEQFTDPDGAIKIEKQLKGWSRRKKIALIEQDWDRLIEYSKNYTQLGSSTGRLDESSTSSD